MEPEAQTAAAEQQDDWRKTTPFKKYGFISMGSQPGMHPSAVPNNMKMSSVYA